MNDFQMMSLIIDNAFDLSITAEDLRGITQAIRAEREGLTE